MVLTVRTAALRGSGGLSEKLNGRLVLLLLAISFLFVHDSSDISISGAVSAAYFSGVRLQTKY